MPGGFGTITGATRFQVPRQNRSDGLPDLKTAIAIISRSNRAGHAIDS
jgi:hypothetical protein